MKKWINSMGAVACLVPAIGIADWQSQVTDSTADVLGEVGTLIVGVTA